MLPCNTISILGSCYGEAPKLEVIFATCSSHLLNFFIRIRFYWSSVNGVDEAAERKGDYLSCQGRVVAQCACSYFAAALAPWRNGYRKNEGDACKKIPNLGDSLPDLHFSIDLQTGINKLTRIPFLHGQNWATTSAMITQFLCLIFVAPEWWRLYLTSTFSDHLMPKLMLLGFVIL